MHSYTDSELGTFSNEDLISEVLFLQDEIDALQEEIGDLNRDKGKLEVQVDNLQDRISDLEFDIDDLKDEIKSLQTIAEDSISTPKLMTELFENEIEKVGYNRFIQNVNDALETVAKYYYSTA